MTPVLAGLGGLVATVLSVAVTAYLGRRAKSGDVETSEAKDLWDTLRAELARQQAETSSLRAEMAAARLEMVTLRSEAVTLRLGMKDLEVELHACHDVNNRLLTGLNIARPPDGK